MEVKFSVSPGTIALPLCIGYWNTSGHYGQTWHQFNIWLLCFHAFVMIKTGGHEPTHLTN